MTGARRAQFVFAGAVALAAAVCALTLPEGLPWNVSVSDAAAGRGPFYARYVFAMFSGNVLAATVTCAALAAGLLASVVNRYLGWRWAASAALVWIFLPPVWNRAITGERLVCLASLGIALVWTLNALALLVASRLRTEKTVPPAPTGEAGVDLPMGRGAARARIDAIASWAALGLAALFALVSCTFHDTLRGEAASVFARGVVQSAAGRIIVMDGACDEQIRRELKLKVEVEERRDRIHSSTSTLTSTSTPNFDFPAISLSDRSDAYRAELSETVRAAFPDETNLWMAANIGAATFVERARAAHPERFYLMNGTTTTLAEWEARWAAFAPCLASSDRFVPVARRHFAFEGNAIANQLADSHAGGRSAKRRRRGERQAWKLYKRLYEEIDPGNASALVNMNELIRRGFDPGGENAAKVRAKLEKFFADKRNRDNASEIVRAAGPIRRDPELMAKLDEMAKAAREKDDRKPDGVTSDLKRLREWNAEMVEAMNAREMDKAVRLARAILESPGGRASPQANAIMGLDAARAGDYVSSEAFLRLAMPSTNNVPPLLLNEYADTLLHLGRLDEAEAWARRAVREAPVEQWFTRLTLAQVLEKKVERAEESDEADEGAVEGMCAEMTALLRRIVGMVPPESEARVRDMLRRVREL